MTRVSGCPFCDLNPSELNASNELCYSRLDKYPVSKGHMLVIPFRHFSNYFDATYEERDAMWSLVEESKNMIREAFNPDGYNIGINIGRAAGQTVHHCHIHVIPRYEGDMDDPRGGVRGVIPDMQTY